MLRSLKVPGALTTHDSVATFPQAGREAQGGWYRDLHTSFPQFDEVTLHARSLHLPIPHLFPWLRDIFKRLKRFTPFKYVISQNPQSHSGQQMSSSRGGPEAQKGQVPPNLTQPLKSSKAVDSPCSLCQPSSESLQWVIHVPPRYLQLISLCTFQGQTGA